MNLESLKELNLNAFTQLLNAFTQHNYPLSSKQKKQLEKLSIASPYAAQHISRLPDIYIKWFEQTEKNSNFDVSSISLDVLGNDEIKIKQSLRQLRHNYMCQIILNDVCLGCSVDVILDQISSLAFRLITLALNAASELLESKHGVPMSSFGEHQRLMIMAMGKLGGGELNFSSDIDLIFIYSEDGDLKGQGNLSYREFYTRVGRLFTKLLNDQTELGFVYRVDLRLRPWGDSGPVVINLIGLENYYQLQGRDWERYALVKAQVVTGNERDKASLCKVIEPFVYRKYHDFNVFSGLGSLKQQIDREARKKRQALNIKLCSGGIREIEFCIQALQILQGGRNKQLQVTSILAMFKLAKDETFYSASELKVLEKSYLFFRWIENRIQMLNDQQTHFLPNNEEDCSRLLCSLNKNSWKQLLLEIETAQRQVNVIFKQLFIEQVHVKTAIDFKQFDESDWLNYVEKIKFEDCASIAKHLTLFFKERIIVSMSSKGQERLNELLPSFLQLIAEKDSPIKLLNLLTELLLAIARRSVYLEMLSMHKPLLQKLIDLFAKSQWLAEEVIRFPILLEGVLIAQADDRFNKKILYSLLKKELKQVNGDFELELDVLRVFKRQQLFYIALQEIEAAIKPLEASAYLSELAQMMLQASYELNLSLMLNQYGSPQFKLKGKIYDAQFAIIAYGKLGGKELHYTSDLDVIFLHDSCGESQETNGQKTIDNAQFFVCLAQKITQTISLMTSSGRVYEIDSRLRPNGVSGFLVSSIEAFQRYQNEKAWVWEHQALVRAQFVAGNDILKAKFNDVKCHVLTHHDKTPDLAKTIVDMRQKMLMSKRKNAAFDIKQSRGGMIDIEFMVQYFVLLNANKLSSLCEYSANIPLLKHLHQQGCLNDEYLLLIDIYQNWHHMLHQHVLQQFIEIPINNQMSNNIDVVKQLWQQCFKINKDLEI